MSIERENNRYFTDKKDEQERHEELIKMLNQTESDAHINSIAALKRLKDTLAKFF